MTHTTEPTIDKIIDELLAEAIEKAITEWAGQEYPNDATFYDVTVKEAKQAIYTDLMELIGEDEPTATKGSKREYLACQDCFEIPEDHARNQLRQELREKVKKYCE